MTKFNMPKEWCLEAMKTEDDIDIIGARKPPTRLERATEGAFNALYGTSKRERASECMLFASRLVAEAVLGAFDEDAIPISGAYLSTDGEHIVVSLEIDGKLVEVIREYCPDVPPISHFVHPTGIRAAIEKSV